MEVSFTINVKLNEKQAETVVKHFGEARMDNLVADMQGTVKTFLDKWAEEDEEVKAARKTTAIITPIGVSEFED